MKTLQLFLLISLGVILASSRTVRDSVEGKRLIKTSEDDPGSWLNEKEMFALIRSGKTFIDITDIGYSSPHKDKVNVNAIPTELKHQAIVNPLKEKINSQRILDFIRQFSSYHNRLYASTTGRFSQTWLLAQVQESVKDYAGNAVVREVDHGYLQRSIVARLQGADPSLATEVVIIGAHLDSINKNGPSLNAPGADDNASGSVVLLEALRVIVESKVVLQRTVEFQWYAAEEVGLRGSRAMAADYKNNGVNVVGMLNLDVVGYKTPGVDKIKIFTSHGELALMVWLRLIATEYLVYGWEDGSCSYACSDHASWWENEFPAVMASEYTPHPEMHTVYDIIQNMDLTQVKEFVKLAIGYVVETGIPVTSTP